MSQSEDVADVFATEEPVELVARRRRTVDTANPEFCLGIWGGSQWDFGRSDQW